MTVYVFLFCKHPLFMLNSNAYKYQVPLVTSVIHFINNNISYEIIIICPQGSEGSTNYATSLSTDNTTAMETQDVFADLLRYVV